MNLFAKMIGIIFLFASLSIVLIVKSHSAEVGNNATYSQTIAEPKGIRESMPDYDRRLYDRMKKANRQNIQIRGIVIIGFVLLIIALTVATIVLVRRTEINDFKQGEKVKVRTNSVPEENHFSNEAQKNPSNQTSRKYLIGSKIEIWAGRLFAMSVCLVLAFFALDYIIGPHLNTRSHLETIAGIGNIRAPKPYVMFAGKEGRPNPTENINTRGYRGANAEMPKPENEFRIFVLGGSTVWNGKPPIAQLLEKKFIENGHGNIRVYNYGVVSSVSGMALARVVHEIADLDPDFVVFYNGGNDMMHAFGPDARIGYPYNFLVWEANPLLESDIKNFPATALFLYGSNSLRFFFREWFREKFSKNAYRNGVLPVSVFNQSWYNAVAKKYVNNSLKAARFSRASGSKFALFFQPTLYSKQPLSPKESTFQAPRGMIKHMSGLQSAILRELAKAKTTSEFPHVYDLSDLYDGISDTVFVDFIHTTQESKKIVADFIFRSLEPLVTQP
jgi:hypothetical protein